jgi:hypothetical protein
MSESLPSRRKVLRPLESTGHPLHVPLQRRVQCRDLSSLSITQSSLGIAADRLLLGDAPVAVDS